MSLGMVVFYCVGSQIMPGRVNIHRIVWSLCFAHSMSHALVCNSVNIIHVVRSRYFPLCASVFGPRYDVGKRLATTWTVVVETSPTSTALLPLCLEEHGGKRRRKGDHLALIHCPGKTWTHQVAKGWMDGVRGERAGWMLGEWLGVVFGDRSVGLGVVGVVNGGEAGEVATFFILWC